MTIKPN